MLLKNKLHRSSSIVFPECESFNFVKYIWTKIFHSALLGLNGLFCYFNCLGITYIGYSSNINYFILVREEWFLILKKTLGYFYLVFLEVWFGDRTQCFWIRVGWVVAQHQLIQFVIYIRLIQFVIYIRLHHVHTLIVLHFHPCFYSFVFVQLVDEFTYVLQVTHFNPESILPSF